MKGLTNKLKDLIDKNLLYVRHEVERSNAMSLSEYYYITPSLRVENNGNGYYFLETTRSLEYSNVEVSREVWDYIENALERSEVLKDLGY